MIFVIILAIFVIVLAAYVIRADTRKRSMSTIQKPGTGSPDPVQNWATTKKKSSAKRADRPEASQKEKEKKQWH